MPDRTRTDLSFLFVQPKLTGKSSVIGTHLVFITKLGELLGSVFYWGVRGNEIGESGGETSFENHGCCAVRIETTAVALGCSRFF